MKSSKMTPFCYACSRIELPEGWKTVENIKKTANIYETLCKDCLIQLSDSLLKDLNDQISNKVCLGG